MLTKYAKENGFGNTRFYVDDGYTGTNFVLPDFIEFTDIIEKIFVGVVAFLIIKILLNVFMILKRVHAILSNTGNSKK